MRKTKTVLATLAAAALVSVNTGTAGAEVTKPVPSAELTDPAGDVPSQNGPGNDRDVVKLTLGSDGTHILVSATLNKDEYGNQAGSVVELLLDTDRSEKTGGTTYWAKQTKPPKTGFEYRSTLSVCMAYGADIGSCAGGPDTPPKSRHARIVLDKFTGAPGGMIDVVNSTTVISGFGPAGPPFKGRVLEGKIPYAQAGLKPGQVVRIVPSESSVAGDEGFFPDVLLSLK